MGYRIKCLVPGTILRGYRSARRWLEDRRNAARTPAEVFDEIYRSGEWGGNSNDPCSGAGSTTASVVEPYVERISKFLRGYSPNKPTIVDLGCGDFRVGKRFLGDCAEYIAVDVVPHLIERHQASHYGDNVSFLCLDIVEHDRPDGDICFLRQVLQHLSNKEILAILPKLAKYKSVFITEHFPYDSSRPRPNIDIAHGSRIRLYRNSGVYLDRSPFNIPSDMLDLFLEVPGCGISDVQGPGVIRTYILQPRRNG